MIDETCPGVPWEVFQLSPGEVDLDYTPTCEQLWIEVISELTDEAHEHRSHHNLGTYNQGCRGPLCRKALRERRWVKNPPVNAARDERTFDPVLDYFHVVVKHRIRFAQLAEQCKENAS